MTEDDKLLTQFYAVFGERGGDVYPGNVGQSRAIADVCHEIMVRKGPLLDEYFLDWSLRDEEIRRTLNVGCIFFLSGNGRAPGRWHNCTTIRF